MKRLESVRGSFYPDTCKEIKRYIKYFDDLDAIKEEREKNARAIIVPHAGYVYSGFTANIAYKSLKEAKRVVVIGPSHKKYFKGIAGSFYDTFSTPCGELSIDKEYLLLLQEKFGLLNLDVTKEHSTEVQMPFVKFYVPNAKVVEIVYGDVKDIAPLVEFILSDKENALVISTDLSHYYPIEKANQLDYVCLEAIDAQESAKLQEDCEACGKIGVDAVLRVSTKLGLQSKLLDYRTSADFSKDKSAVVGYVSASFY